MCLQEQEIQKYVFFIKYSGSNGFDEDFKKTLGIKRYESFVDVMDSYVNAVITTHVPMRPLSVKRIIEGYNEARPKDKQIILRAHSAVEDEIMTLSRKEGETLKKSCFYRRIIAAKERNDPSYRIWPGNSEEVKNRNLNKELHIDMVQPFNVPPSSSEKPVYNFDDSCDEDRIPLGPKAQECRRRYKRKSSAIEDSEDDERNPEKRKPEDPRDQEAAGILAELGEEEPAPPECQLTREELYNALIAEKDARLAEKDARIADKDARLADKDTLHAEVLRAEHARHAEVLEAKNETIRVLLNALKPAVPA